MKKILLSIISVLLMLFSSVLITHLFSEESIEIDQTDEQKDTSEDVMNEINDSLLDDFEEMDIGEMV